MKQAAAVDNQDLYPDRHLNVFVAYRSHTLDYNVTRAIIATLRWSVPALTDAFLQEVVGITGGASQYHYDLHACDYEDFDPARVGQQVVLGVSLAGKLADNLPPLDDEGQGALLLNILRAPAFLNSPPLAKLEQVRKALGRPEIDMDDLATLFHTLEELEEGCHPDGWIFSSEGEGLCVVIEAKLLQLLDLSQLQRYADVYYARNFEAEDMVLTTWEKIAAFFASYRGHDDVRTAFLCGQLVDYLDLLGLAKFSQFRPYDFDLDAAQEVLPKFLRFAERVHSAGGERGLPLGLVRMSPTGARIELSGLPGELALDIREAGIRVEHTCGDSAGPDLPGRASVDAILAANTGDANPLAGQTLEGLTVRVERLRSQTADGEVFVEREIVNTPLDPAEFGYALAELRRQHPPAESARDAAGHFRRGKLCLGRVLPMETAFGDGEALVGQVLDVVAVLVKAARQLIPIEEPASEGATA